MSNSSNSQEIIYKDPPPPLREQGSRSVDHGGATEQTRLLNEQQSPQYTPTENFVPGNKMPLASLKDKPGMTTCPECGDVVWSKIEYGGFWSFIPCCVSTLRD
jgi:hypothetical protein